MPINYDLLDEGDALNAASLNTRISSLQTGVNDLTKEDLGEQALRSEHVSSIVNYNNMILYGTTKGMMKVSFLPDNITPVYDNYIGNGPAVRTVVHIGPQAGAQGYSIISSRALVGIAPPGPFPGAQTDCNISFSPSVNVVSPTTPATGLSSTTYCTALLVRLNVSLIEKTSPGSRDGVVIGIVWEADGALGTYNFLEQSETGVGSEDTSMVLEQCPYSDISTAALITSTDTGGSLVARVSGVIAQVENAAAGFKIREWNMSIIPIFGGTL